MKDDWQLAQTLSDKDASLIERLLAPDLIGGTLLILATAVALVWANSPAGASYDALWSMRLTIDLGSFEISKPLIHWINDLLMAIFFLLIGLEMKAELLTGELNSPSKAALPAIAAIGGMVAPAVVFLLLTYGTPAAKGWGIPIATDIAFALGCMRMLGKRGPGGLKVFLTAVAIIDDLGAILVITIFYGHDLSVAALSVAAALTLALYIVNRAGVRRILPYLLLGTLLWFAALKSGIHATIAGVILGLSIPADALRSSEEALGRAGEILVRAGLESKSTIHDLFAELNMTESPLRFLERSLSPWVNLAIIPIFALANAGVHVANLSIVDLKSPAAVGIVLGLVVGKRLGIFSATYAAVRAGWGSVPSGVSWQHLYGAGVLGGIGFTMSLFITVLAYGEGTQMAEQAKLAILVASLTCAIDGLIVLGKVGGRALEASLDSGQAGQEQ